MQTFLGSLWRPYQAYGERQWSGLPLSVFRTRAINGRCPKFRASSIASC